jgi:uncharacterized protein GlcG (DUF336 family)
MAALLGLALLFAAGQVGLAQSPAPAPRPELAPSITLAEARAIIEGAVAFAHESKMHMAVVVVDAYGNLVSADSMDGVRTNDIRGAEGKAFASAIFRQTTQAKSTRPGRTATSGS